MGSRKDNGMLDFLKKISEQLISPRFFVQKRYATFVRLLAADRAAHTRLAELETIYYTHRAVDINTVRQIYADFASHVDEMISCLHTLTSQRYGNISAYYRKFDFYSRFALAAPKIDSDQPFILPLSEKGKSVNDDRLTGGKGLHLHQLIHRLQLPVPDGFIITTAAWNHFLDHNRLREKIRLLLAEIDIGSLTSLKETSSALLEALDSALIPPLLERELQTAVVKLKGAYPNSLFAVRSSAVGEDLALSFAGQYSSRLNVAADDIAAGYRAVVSSKYAPEALLYRIMNGLDDEETPMAVIVQVMVKARVSGVVTTSAASVSDVHPAKVHWVRGLGDTLMGGVASSSCCDVYEKKGELCITGSSSAEPGCPSPDIFHRLAGWAEQVSGLYGCPQELEWSADNDNVYLLQARRFQAAGQHEGAPPVNPDVSRLELLGHGGVTGSPGICCGKASLFPNQDDLANLAPNTILITETTSPALVALLPRLAGVIARRGSCADHFASVAREFSVPLLVGAEEVINRITDGDDLTLWADRQSVYRGTVALAENQASVQRLEASPLHHLQKLVIGFTSPLALVDPFAPGFSPESCRSMHDIIRFCHEKAVQAMFIESADNLLRKPSAVRLETSIPLQLFIIDVAGGTARQRLGRSSATLDEIECLPLHALWRGLSHPGVNWRERSHYDWQSYDSVSLAGGIAGKEDTALSSFCLIAPDYLNVNIRFGYHFTQLDCFCGNIPEENYILLRFAGGGGTLHGKDLRLDFISRVLNQLDFHCERSGDMLDGRLLKYDKAGIVQRLEKLGHLLGAARLLDMVLQREDDLGPMIDDFFKGVYDFSKRG